MNAATTALIDALGWALLHSTWQLAAMACGLWLLLRLNHNAPATTRYGICTATLFAAPLCFAGTVSLCWDAPAVEFSSLEAFAITRPVAGQALPAASLPSQAPLQQGFNTAAALPWVVSLWFAGMLLFGTRFIGGFLQARSLRLRGHRPVSEALQERVRTLALSLGIDHPVVAVESFEVAVPMVVGIIRPLILLPSSALIGLSADQLESVLLHELAHIRRRDLWVNFIQGLVEVMLFFHPAVWWMSSRLRAERELCCDDAVLAQGTSGKVYAHALLRLSEQRLQMAHSAAATDGSLRFRIERLIGEPGPPQRSIRGLAAAFLFCCVGLMSAQQSLAAGQDLSQMVDELMEMDITTPAGVTLSTAEEDRVLREGLQELMAHRKAILDRMDALMQDDPERWELIVELRSAQVDEHVADMLEGSTIPASLNEEQAGVYRATLSQRSARFRSDALSRYQRVMQMDGPSELLDEARAAAERLQSPHLPGDDGLPAALESLDTDALLKKASTTSADAPFAGRIWLATAERLFDENNAPEAMVWYKAAADQLSPEQAVFAHYKIAWCHYNLGRRDMAISEMEAVVAAKVEPFRQEGLKDLMRFYVDIDQAELTVDTLTEDGGKVELTGVAVSNLVVSRFLKGLEASGSLAKVYLHSVEEIDDGGVMTKEFTISARLSLSTSARAKRRQ